MSVEEQANRFVLDAYRLDEELYRVECRASLAGWSASAQSHAYVAQFDRLVHELSRFGPPQAEDLTVEAGELVRLRLFLVDPSGHVACRIRIRWTGPLHGGRWGGLHWQDEPWQMEATMATELAAVDRFARSLAGIRGEGRGRATLDGVPA
jgi:hypothetical protein